MTMPPADFRALWNDMGCDVGEIAKRCGVTRKTVVKRALRYRAAGYLMINRQQKRLLRSLPSTPDPVGCLLAEADGLPVDARPNEVKLADEVRDRTGLQVEVRYFRQAGQQVIEWQVEGHGRVRLPKMLELAGHVRFGEGL